MQKHTHSFLQFPRAFELPYNKSQMICIAVALDALDAGRDLIMHRRLDQIGAKETEKRVWRFDDLEDLVGTITPLRPARETFTTRTAASVLDCKLHIATIEDMTVLRFSTATEIRFQRTLNASQHIELYFIDSGLQTVDMPAAQFEAPAGTCYLLSQHGQLEQHYHPGTTVVAIHLPRRRISTWLTTGAGKVDEVFSAMQPVVRLADGTVDTLRQMAQLLINDEDKHPFAGSPVGASAYMDAVIATFVTGWPRGAVQAKPAIYPASVRLALDFIDRHLGEDFTMDELARRSGVSTRALQRLFRDFLGTQPMSYIARLRLERIRKALADPSETSMISEIAGRWGYSHMGYFTSRYREMFGETASQTRQKASVAKSSD